MTVSILLERKDDLLARIYRDDDAPQLTYLFDHTELHLYQQQSPVWLRVDTNSALLERVLGTPCQLPGLVIESQAPEDLLLAHLRHILLVRSTQAGRCVLRYWSPITASYFFTAGDAVLLATWLGPIASISWQGGTWADPAQAGSGVLRIDNPHASTWQPPAKAHPRVLDPLQEQALQRQQREHFAWQWCKHHEQVTFAQAMGCLDEQLANGVTSKRVLQQTLQSFTATLQNRNAHP